LYKMPDSPAKLTVSFELRGAPTNEYLDNLGEEGQNIARAILGADEPMADIDQLYVDIGASDRVRIWRFTRKGEQRAVGLDFGIYVFNVYAGIVGSRPLRLVSAKIFHSK